MADEDLTLRDRLALARTDLANERTLLAYLRTAIMLLSTGGAVIKLLGAESWWLISGWLLVGLGVAAALFGATRFWKQRKEWHH